MSLGNAPDYASIHHYYDPVEICFLCDYLRVPRPEALRSRPLEVRLDDQAGQSPEGFIRPVIGAGGSNALLIENCVARLILNAIEDRLPQWFARGDEGRAHASCLQERWEGLTGVGLINGDAER